MPNVALNPGVPVVILNAITATGAGSTFALPARACVLAWQLSYDVNPSVIDIDLEISMDGVSWTVLDTSTQVTGEFRDIDHLTAAVFVRAIVNTNTGSRAATVQLIAKAGGI